MRAALFLVLLSIASLHAQEAPPKAKPVNPKPKPAQPAPVVKKSTADLEADALQHRRPIGPIAVGDALAADRRLVHRAGP